MLKAREKNDEEVKNVLPARRQWLLLVWTPQSGGVFTLKGRTKKRHLRFCDAGRNISGFTTDWLWHEPRQTSWRIAGGQRREGGGDVLCGPSPQ